MLQLQEFLDILGGYHLSSRAAVNRDESRVRGYRLLVIGYWLLAVNNSVVELWLRSR